MDNWRDSIPSKYLKAADLDGKPHLVTIKKFSVEKTDTEKFPCVWFSEFDKGFRLNVTNGKKIEGIAGSANPARWSNARVVIFPTETELRGETVDCIRVRAPKAGAKLPPPPAAELDVADEEQHEGYEPTDDDVPF
jgi:hypothetical protein